MGRSCALLAGVGTLLPGLAAARMQPYPAFLALLSSCVAVLCAPAMRLVLRWRPGRPVGADERACAALLAFALLTGLCALWPPGGLSAFLPDGAGGGARLSGRGGGAGSTVAVRAARRRRHAGNGGFGGAGRRGGGHAALARAAFRRSGLRALRIARRPLRAGGLSGPLIPALAALLYVLAPEAWLAALGETLFRAPPRSVQGEATRALNALSAAFGELAAGGGQSAGRAGRAFDERARLCDACPNYARCWAGEDGRAVRLFCQTLRDAACEGEAAEEVPPDLLRACRRGERLREVAMQEAGKARLRRDADRCAGEMFRQSRAHTRRSRPHARAAPGTASPRTCAGARARVRARRGTPSGDAHLLRPLPTGG